MITARSGKRIQIVAPNRFRDLIRAVTGAPSQAGLRQAASKSGLSSVQLRRWRRSGAKSIRVESLRGVGRLLSDDQKNTLDACLLNSKAGEVLSQYAAWLGMPAHRLRRLMLYKPDRKSFKEVFSLAGPLSSLDRRRAQAMATIRDRCGPLFDAFDSVLVRQGHTPYRAGHAIWRVVDGLLEFDASGQVERHWENLSAKELSDFIRAGIIREMILLRRSADLQRIQEVALQPIDRSGKTRFLR